jgi:FtsZ-binding cell division protein ZapB
MEYGLNIALASECVLLEILQQRTALWSLKGTTLLWNNANDDIGEMSARLPPGVSLSVLSTDVDDDDDTDYRLCGLLGIPSSMSISDLLVFLEPYIDEIWHIFAISSPHTNDESLLTSFAKMQVWKEIDEEVEVSESITNNIGSQVSYTGPLCAAILYFRSARVRAAFINIYNGLHFTSSSTSVSTLSPLNADLEFDSDLERDRWHIDKSVGDSTATGCCLAIPLKTVSYDAIGKKIGQEKEKDEVRMGNAIEEKKEKRCETRLISSSFLRREHLGEGWGNDAASRPTSQLLPTCIVCLARLDPSFTGMERHQIPNQSNVPFIRHLASLPSQCFVCRLGDRDFMTSHRGTCACISCGITENLWVCLICGHLGCGRYTRQHATLHFHHYGHSFSLEVATGRVWDYDRDTFVHDMKVQQALHTTDRCDGEYKKEYSPSVDIGDGHSNDTSLGLLDSSTREKMQNIISDYEAILHSQLEDQRLHYEHLLARESREALSRKQRMFSEGNTSATLVDMPSHPAPGLAPGDLPSIDGGESDEYWQLKLAYATTSPEDIEVIERLKTEISALEQDYQALTAETADAEHQHAAIKKENKNLLLNQKDLMNRFKAMEQRIYDFKQRREHEEESMHEELRDLEFFMNAQERLDAEGGTGDVIITESNSNSSSMKNRSNRRGNKGGEKKY